MYSHTFLVTSVRGTGVAPMMAASDALGVMAFMKAALGVRFLAGALAAFLAGAAFLAATFLAGAAFLATAFFAGAFFAAAFFAGAFFAAGFAAFFAVAILNLSIKEFVDVPVLGECRMSSLFSMDHVRSEYYCESFIL